MHFVVPVYARCLHACSIIPENKLERWNATGERVDDIVQEDVLLMKVDVEGLEPGVIASAAGLLQHYK